MATNLIGLVNQLQQMENTFTAVLLEAALKLSALTETSVFVIVESGESRRFGGSRHLCESYATSSLKPIGNDIQVNLRDFQPSLTETPLLHVPLPLHVALHVPLPLHVPPHPHVPPHQPPTTTSFNPGIHFLPVSSSAESGQASARAFPSPPNLNVSGHRPSPQPASNSPLIPKNRKRTQAFEISAPSPPKIPKTHAPGLKMEFSIDEKPGLEAVSETKGKYSSSTSFDVNDINLASPCGSNDSDIILDDEVLADDPTTSAMAMSAPSNATISIGQNQNFGQEIKWVHDFVNDDLKASVLREVCDETIADKNNPAGRIFSSFLYAFGKQVAVVSHGADILDWKKYFSSCFEAMWGSFPNWHILDQSGLDCGRSKAEKLSVRSFCRVTAQVACRNKLRRMKLC